MTNYTSLHNQTQYSLLDSIVDIKELFKKAKELNYSSIAITDHGSCASFWNALKYSKEFSIKFIAGVELYFKDNLTSDEKFRHIILLAKNAVGYKNLLTLTKKGFDNNEFNGKRVYSLIDWKLLKIYSEGLICLTACGNGIISQLLMNGKYQEAEESLLRLKNIFGESLGIEVQPNNMKRNANVYNDAIDQQFLNRQLINLGKKHSIKVVPTCNTHYLDKEDSDVHDVLLSIGARQSVYSNFRLKYPVPDFYLKSGDEVKNFFARNYGEEFATEICNNTIYFSNLCEEPEWIDPKFSNPSGKELPIFPVKDELDYNEFLMWKSKQSENLQKLEDDKLYLRYKCYLAFEDLKPTLDKEKISTYENRILEELETLEYQGFSSYMLIVADYVRWCNNNGVSVGPGRGCTTDKTNVLTENGYKKISDIQIGEKVYTHNGNLNLVKDIFKFKLEENEKLIKIKTQKSFDQLSFTKDHKLLVVKREVFNTVDKKCRTNWKKTNRKNLEWVKAKDLKSTDLLWMQYPVRTTEAKYNDQYLDLSQFVEKGKIFDKHIEYKFQLPHKLSVAAIKKKLNVKGNGLYNIKIKKMSKLRSKDQMQNFLNLLAKENITLEEWQDLDLTRYCKIKRYLKLDKNFYFLLGLWIGDGFLINSNYKFGIGISSNKTEITLLEGIKKYLTNLGFYPSLYYKKNENALQLEINNEILFNLFNFFIPDYKRSSDTKHLPFNFRQLNDENLFNLIRGLFYADGTTKISDEAICTTSKRLALELKESLLYLKHSSSILTPKIFTNDGANRKQAYIINFPSIFDNKQILNTNFYKDNGYFVRISSIEEVSDEQYVYDIEVENNHSYLTTNYVSHNSVGGCFIAFLLNIHKADSIKYDLIFARFQNKMRLSPPDIDQDIATSGRDKVLNYLKSKYGSTNMCSISNFNSITPKVYVRDVARALELGGSKEDAVKIGNNLADMIPADMGQESDFSKIINKLPLFSEYCKKYPQLEKYKLILHKPRAVSQHAAGIIISERSLEGLIPLRKDKEGNNVIEYDKDISEENGFVKMDILGLSTLDIINSITSEIKLRHHDFNNEHLNYDANDEKTYNLITSGNTFGVFQFGTSAGTIDLCKKYKPKNIQDLAIITTLARPAAADIRQDYIATKEGRKKVTLLHSSLKNAFEKTLNYGLFDESILQLGRDVAGWDYNQADKIRKMIKEKGKNPSKDKKLQEEFIASAIKNGISEEMSNRIWNEEISKFGSYTFCRAHATTYSMISYQTAYLKAHYTLEFLLANLMAEIQSNSPMAKTNIATIKKEIRALNVKILPPDLNKSDISYKIIDDNTLLTGLDALKFVSDDAIKDIISKRPFKDFTDFMIRVDSRKVRSNTIQALSSSGCLDIFNISRKSIYLYCSDFRKKLQVWVKKHNPNIEQFSYPWVDEPNWNISELYALEQNYLGEGFICKPAQAYGNFFKDFHKVISDIKKSPNKTKLAPVKCILRDFFEFRVKKETSKYYGQPMAKITIEDRNGDQISCTIFPDRWQMIQEKIKRSSKKVVFENGLALSIGGSVNLYEGEIGFILDDLYDIKLPPILPLDLKAKKVNLKASKLELKENSKELIEDLEDQLYDQGLIDLDEEIN